ncbi:hypothetical protein C8F04DRAFT_1195666 [Mycena alexandri]|uniref:Uncharacterized protein n=1 Tax=Mycena alexandri TaxID=1745969 RepID=A0AAD6WNM0_9AGAR|nr:hypothetical protein C8F04DRAFT_1195666 [Mycena alexandri]
MWVARDLGQIIAYYFTKGHCRMDESPPSHPIGGHLVPSTTSSSFFYFTHNASFPFVNLQYVSKLRGLFQRLLNQILKLSEKRAGVVPHASVPCTLIIITCLARSFPRNLPRSPSTVVARCEYNSRPRADDTTCEFIRMQIADTSGPVHNNAMLWGTSIQFSVNREFGKAGTELSARLKLTCWLTGDIHLVYSPHIRVASLPALALALGALRPVGLLARPIEMLCTLDNLPSPSPWERLGKWGPLPPPPSIRSIPLQCTAIRLQNSSTPVTALASGAHHSTRRRDTVPLPPVGSQGYMTMMRANKCFSTPPTTRVAAGPAPPGRGWPAIRTTLPARPSVQRLPRLRLTSWPRACFAFRATLPTHSSVQRLPQLRLNSWSAWCGRAASALFRVLRHTAYPFLCAPAALAPSDLVRTCRRLVANLMLFALCFFSSVSSKREWYRVSHHTAHGFLCAAAAPAPLELIFLFEDEWYRVSHHTAHGFLCAAAAPAPLELFFFFEDEVVPPSPHGPRVPLCSGCPSSFGTRGGCGDVGLVVDRPGETFPGLPSDLPGLSLDFPEPGSHQPRRPVTTLHLVDRGIGHFGPHLSLSTHHSHNDTPSKRSPTTDATIDHLIQPTHQWLNVPCNLRHQAASMCATICTSPSEDPSTPHSFRYDFECQGVGEETGAEWGGGIAGTCAKVGEMPDEDKCVLVRVVVSVGRAEAALRDRSYRSTSFPTSSTAGAVCLVGLRGRAMAGMLSAPSASGGVLYVYTGETCVELMEEEEMCLWSGACDGELTGATKRWFRRYAGAGAGVERFNAGAWHAGMTGASARLPRALAPPAGAEKR